MLITIEIILISLIKKSFIKTLWPLFMDEVEHPEG